MRFVRLCARPFGPLRSREFGLDSNVVAIFGRNESGKSSFRSALETVLYGFDPASRDQHPLWLWDEGRGGDLTLEAEIAFDDGSGKRVERTLQATGKSRFAPPGEEFEGRRGGNRPLAELAGLPREVYRTLYSLETDQLEALDRGTRDHVDEWLLPHGEERGQRPVSEVREEIRKEHLDLWRPDRRGRPRARTLRDEVAAARIQVREAIERERELRAEREEGERLRAELESLAQRKRALERARDDAPYLRELFELRRRSRRLGKRVDLSGLDGTPIVDPASLVAEIEELDAALAEPRERLEREERTIDAFSARVLARGDALEAALAGAARDEADALHQEELEQRSASLRRRVLQEMSSVLLETPGDACVDALRGLPIEALRAAQESWAEAREAHLLERPPQNGPPGFVWWVGAAGALAAAAASLVELPPAVPVLGAIAVLGALAAARFWRASDRSSAHAPPACPDEVRELLGGLPVPENLVASPAELLRLIEALNRALGALRELGEAEERAGRLASAVEERAVRAARLAEEIGVEPGDAGVLAGLRRALETATECQRRVERDRAERARAQAQLDTSAPALERKRSRLRDVDGALRHNAPEIADRYAAWREVERRLQEERFLDRREQELREDARWERFEDDPRVRSDEPPRDADWLPDVEAAREASIEELEREIAWRRERLGELRSALESDPGSQQARARERVEELEAELHSVGRERDRLAMLESVLTRAEREFRDAHQPDVLRRASAWLERVTEGRYSRLEVVEGAGGGLRVTAAERGEPLLVGKPLSRGTLDQIFLCLRLGLLDHLDEGRERFPLVLDDALVRCDAERRAEVYRLLVEVSRSRQVFLLSCHEALVEEAERALRPLRIDLTR